jgi:hypothetical protein
MSATSEYDRKCEGLSLDRRVSVYTDNLRTIPMKFFKSALICISLVTASASYSQQTDSQKPQETVPAPKLTKFDLDFAGGTPDDLVIAIQKALGRPLNAVVPPQFSKRQLPPLKMRSVDVAQLFNALYQASTTNEPVPNSQMPGQYFVSTFGFKTEGAPTDDSVWFFFGGVPPVNPPPQRFCQYFLLTPYLEKGLSVDDITTAIQTGWKMLGTSDRAELSYHPETKLLIIVCDRDNFEVVRSVLAALKDSKPNTPASTSSAKMTAEQKTDK